MINKPLSDAEIEDLMGLCSGQNVQGLVTYVNRLIHQRGQGLDTCARPLSFRQDDECKDTCFAKGYLEKVKTFLNETWLRNCYGPSAHSETTEKVDTYIDSLIKEINTFFK